MASIIQVGKKWRAQVRRNGAAQTKTFSSQARAAAWAAGIEAALEGAREDAAVAVFDQRAWTALFAGARVSGLPPEVAALPRLKVERCCGVYFLFAGPECVYVGKSDNVLARVQQHFPSKDFDSFAWMNVPRADLDRVEREYIETIRPRLNVMHRGTRAGMDLPMTGLRAA